MIVCVCVCVLQICVRVPIQGVLVCGGDLLQGYLGASTDELSRRLVVANRGPGQIQGLQGYHY